MNEMRKDRRAPASLKVKYKSATVDDFIEQFGADVSRGGIFIKTKKPLDTGALLKFEFQLQSGSAVIHGVGRVAWRRLEDKARADLPAGMGIKFIKLDETSRAVIERIEARHGSNSRFEQTEHAELAPPLSSLPPNLTLQGIPSPPAPPPSSGSHSGRRPVPNVRAPGAEPTKEQPTFRPPPPAISSIPPALADAWPSSAKPPQAPQPTAAGVKPTVPKGALGSSFFPPSAARKGPPSARSSSRDASEFLASAFSVGGAGHEVRSAARVQVERARRDPESVDLANELFGDLSEPSNNQADANKVSASDSDAFADLHPPSDPKPPSPHERSLSDKIPSIEELVNETTHAGDGAAMRAPDRAAAVSTGPSLSPLEQAGPKPLALTLSGPPAKDLPPLRPNQVQKGFSLGSLALVSSALLAIATAAYFFMQSGQPPTTQSPPVLPAQQAVAPNAPLPAVPEPSEPSAAPSAPAPAPVDVSVSITSEPRGAEVLLDDKPSGSTPVTVTLKTTQSVQLSLKSPGYAPKTQALTPEVGMPAQHFVLAPLEYALVIRTDPPGATVRVNDLSVVSPEPLALGHLDGLVTAQIEKEGFQRMSRTLRLEDFVERDGAMRADVSLSLSPLPGGARRRPAPRTAESALAPAAPPPEPSAAPAPSAPVMQVKPEAAPEEAAQKPADRKPAEAPVVPEASAAPAKPAPSRVETAAPAPSAPPPSPPATP